MSITSSTTTSNPKNRWIITRSIVFERHAKHIERVVDSLNPYKVELHAHPVLGIQGLSESDLVWLEVIHPGRGFGKHSPGSSLIYDEDIFAEVQETIALLFSHVAPARLIVANIFLSDENMFRKLKAKLARHPKIFRFGLQRL